SGSPPGELTPPTPPIPPRKSTPPAPGAGPATLLPPRKTPPWGAAGWGKGGRNPTGGARNKRGVAAEGAGKAPRAGGRPGCADGGFQWVAVGNGTAGQTNVLDGSGTNHFGPCAESDLNEEACSLNVNGLADAEDPRVAAGTLTPGQPTVPWVVWAEETGDGRH